MTSLKDGNWGLKLLALILAVVVYCALKDEPARNQDSHDRHLFQQH